MEIIFLPFVLTNLTTTAGGWEELILLECGIGVRGGGLGGPLPPGLEKFQGKLCFQGKRKLLKNPEW